NWQPHADIAKIRAKQKRGEALQKKEEPSGCEQLIDGGRAEDWRDDQRMHNEPEPGDGGNCDKKNEWQRPAQVHEEDVDDVHAAHDEIGIRDPYHIDDAEDQIETERKQRQHAAEQQAVDHGFKKENVHYAMSVMPGLVPGMTPGVDLACITNKLQPHVGLADDIMILQLHGASRHADVARFDQIRAIHEVEDLLHVLLDNQHGKPFGADAADHFEHLLHPPRCH